MLKKIRAHNEELLRWFRNEQNQHAIRRQMLIKDILSDYACFFKMPLEEAFAILRDLAVPQEEYFTVYAAVTNQYAYSQISKQATTTQGGRLA